MADNLEIWAGGHQIKLLQKATSKPMCFIRTLTEESGGDRYDPEQTSNHMTVWSLKHIQGLECGEVRLAQKHRESLLR